MKIVQISGHARPSSGIRRSLGILSGTRGRPLMSVGQALADTLAISKLGELLRTAVLAEKTSDGRIDTRDVAARIVRALVDPNGTPSLASRIDDATMITALAQLLTEAFDKGYSNHETAAHILREMRRHQK